VKAGKKLEPERRVLRLYFEQQLQWVQVTGAGVDQFLDRDDLASTIDAAIAGSVPGGEASPADKVA